MKLQRFYISNYCQTNNIIRQVYSSKASNKRSNIGTVQLAGFVLSMFSTHGDSDSLAFSSSICSSHTRTSVLAFLRTFQTCKYKKMSVRQCLAQADTNTKFHIHAKFPSLIKRKKTKHVKTVFVFLQVPTNFHL